MLSLCKIILPLLFFSIPDRIDNRVDFPHPDGPTIAKYSPSFTDNVKFLIAVVSPLLWYFFDNLLNV